MTAALAATLSESADFRPTILLVDDKSRIPALCGDAASRSGPPCAHGLNSR